MTATTSPKRLAMFAILVTVTLVLLPPRAQAHCDTLSGPVVTDAQHALDSGDVVPVLKWVGPENESEIRSLFDRTLEARQKGKDIQELVDMHFFETLVRLHRAGEGAPYTGLKPADTPVEPGIEAAEKALESDTDVALVEEMQDELKAGLHDRFVRVTEAKKHRDESVAAGREYVAAYVNYIHYADRLHVAMTEAYGHGHKSAVDDHGQAAHPTSEISPTDKQ